MYNPEKCNTKSRQLLTVTIRTFLHFGLDFSGVLVYNALVNSHNGK